MEVLLLLLLGLLTKPNEDLVIDWPTVSLLLYVEIDEQKGSLESKSLYWTIGYIPY